MCQSHFRFTRNTKLLYPYDAYILMIIDSKTYTYKKVDDMVYISISY